MKELNETLKGEAITVVNSTNTAISVKSGSLPVFATPMMISLMEEATCNACCSLLDEGETTVGIGISVTHDKASGLGSVITAFAVLEEIDGRKLTFSVSAKDEMGDTIGQGSIERFVVLKDNFMKRVNK